MAANASYRKDIRELEKAAKRALVVRGEVISGIMSIANGREWMHSLLTSLHFFTDPFSPDPYIHAAQSGQRGIGTQIFGDIMGFCPKQFTLMIEEHYGRLSAAAERSSKPNPNGRDYQPSGSADGDGDYDPGDYDPLYRDLGDDTGRAEG